MIFEPDQPFVPTGYQVKYATEAWEIRGAAALRQNVFCQEQGIFSGTDRDAIDDVATPIVALSMLGVAADSVVGTVRIHEEKKGLWWGSRLAVAMNYRKVGAIGSALIRLAVCSAHARGCARFLAHVQSQNAPLFQRLHWKTLDIIDLHGRPHHLMQADLGHYPPFCAPNMGFLTLRKAA